MSVTSLSNSLSAFFSSTQSTSTTTGTSSTDFSELLGQLTNDQQDLFAEIEEEHSGEQKILDSLYQVLDTEWASDENDTSKKDDAYSLLGDTSTMADYYFAMMQRNATDFMKKAESVAGAASSASGSTI